MATSMRNLVALRWALTLVVVAALVTDVYVHFHLAAGYSGVRSSVLSQADLFRVEATAAVIAAVAVLLRPRRYTAAFAFVVLAAGTAAVVVYRYVDVGAFGPFPDMYEPLWYGEKTVSAIAEGIGAVAALALFGVLHVEAGRAVRTPAQSVDGNAVRALN